MVEPSKSQSGLNADAPEFSFNLGAAEFVMPSSSSVFYQSPAIMEDEDGRLYYPKDLHLDEPEPYPGYYEEQVIAYIENWNAHMEPEVTETKQRRKGGAKAAPAPKKVFQPKKPKEPKATERPVNKEELITRQKQQVSETQEEGAIIEPDSREPVNIVFIGHVDAGKSTTCGNILLILKKVDERTVEKYEQEARDYNKESWWIAYIMDQNEEERERGKTIELGRAYFETVSKRFTILDAPGHRDYVPNMIAGASQADYAGLVVSARIGEFETGFDRGGQTTEHAMLAKSCGIGKLVVLVNKMDEVGWSQERFNQIKSGLSVFLRDTCKWDIDHDVYWVPVASLRGLNIKDRVDPSICPWYSGPSLLDLLDSIPAPNRHHAFGLRIPILDGFRDQGLFVLGKIEGGKCVRNQEVIVLPLKVKCEIAELYGPEDVRMMYAGPGENLKLKIRCSDDLEIKKGYILCDPQDKCHVAFEFLAEMLVVEMLEHKPLITAGYDCVIHIHTAVADCSISMVEGIIDPVTKKKVKVPFGKVGSRMIVRIRCREEICVETFKDMPQMGRFTLRDEGRTIALGKVTQVFQDVDQAFKEAGF